MEWVLSIPIPQDMIILLMDITHSPLIPQDTETLHMDYNHELFEVVAEI